MAHSFAERPTLSCPECGQAFSADVWVVIHAAERPDLLASVRDGTSHAVTCPCGHTGRVDVPLLLFRPGEAWPVLCSPARGTTGEEDEPTAAALLDRLAEGLGATWQEEWLEGVLLVPRAELASTLAEAEPQADVVAEHIPSDGSATLPSYRADMERAKAATARYQATADLATLDEAAAAWERVLGNPYFSTASEQLQLAARNNAAIVFVRRYHSHGRRWPSRNATT